MFRLATVLVIVFLLSGGVSSFKVFTQGASSGLEARYALTGVFAFGFLFAGVLGLKYLVANKDSSMCLLGLATMVFCYFSIELIGWFANGFVPWIR